MPEIFSEVREPHPARVREQHPDKRDFGDDLRRMRIRLGRTSLRPSASRTPMATKKMGVEMAAARAEMIPHANIAARISESAAMSMASFHPFSATAATI